MYSKVLVYLKRKNEKLELGVINFMERGVECELRVV